LPAWEPFLPSWAPQATRTFAPCSPVRHRTAQGPCPSRAWAEPITSLHSPDRLPHHRISIDKNADRSQLFDQFGQQTRGSRKRRQARLRHNSSEGGQWIAPRLLRDERRHR
jgi:hypothetical protein